MTEKDIKMNNVNFKDNFERNIYRCDIDIYSNRVH